jgi:hypothetical protein
MRELGDGASGAANDPATIALIQVLRAQLESGALSTLSMRAVHSAPMPFLLALN